MQHWLNKLQKLIVDDHRSGSTETFPKEELWSPKEVRVNRMYVYSKDTSNPKHNVTDCRVGSKTTLVVRLKIANRKDCHFKVPRAYLP
jgi:hypothetical protein